MQLLQPACMDTSLTIRSPATTVKPDLCDCLKWISAAQRVRPRATRRVIGIGGAGMSGPS
ncbi:hypothetical protein Aau02nite_33520 [Amorphoplanes auranticolor]|uniref:Uncharacterized protein n=1 Tax=Actinoplanes auranticolor TaxID=47988 RepID=A0A919SAR2_9ACTN|nr:hypothetical protein Aau02nite_33520 [Actinoplanes auranticolor]